MAEQAWVACLGRQNCLPCRINVSLLRINNSILNESERPKTSDLNSYNYIYLRYKEF